MNLKLLKNSFPVGKLQFYQGCTVLFLLTGSFFPHESFANTKHPVRLVDHVRSAPPVHGKIVDKTTGQPLLGVSVKVKGSTIGTSTDAGGVFALEAPDNAILEISIVGYETQEVHVAGKTSLTIGLKAGAKNLNEVVVIGYGVQKKTSLTAAVSTINPTEIAQKPIVNLTNGLIGRASGVIATQGSGEPGVDGSGIQIRGAGSTGLTSPLLIVDGVPRDFSRLDPNTVETFTILKDAAAVAPYGVAGANGVILVTTKRGKSGKATLTYNGYAGIQNPTRVPKFVNSFQYAQLRNEAATNDGIAPYASAYDLQKFKDHSDPDGHPDGHPLQDIIINNRLITYHNLTISGGNDDFRYFASVGYNRQDGMWSTTYLNKYNGSLNLTANATRTTTVNFSAIAYEEDQHFPAPGAGSIIDQAERQAPTTPIYYSNGLNSGYIGQSLIGEIYGSGYHTNQNNSLLTQLSVDQKLPVKGLSIRGVVSYDNGPDPLFTSNNTSVQRDWKTPITFYTVDTSQHPYVYNKGNQGNTKSTLKETYSQNHTLTLQGFVNYAGSFGKSDISAVAVVEKRRVKYETFWAQKINYNLDLDELDYGGPLASDASNGGSSSGQNQLGYVYRVSYGFDKKYLFDATGRYDGNYLFGPGHRFGFFPAFSAGWRLSEEDFIKQFHWIDNLKLRASWGKSGAYPAVGGTIQTYQFLSPYNVSSGSAVIGNSATQGINEALQGNPAVTWEHAAKTDIGLEGSLWGGVLGFEADYFYEKRNNMLVGVNAALPAEYGIPLGLVNGGIMKNQGIDLTLTTFKNFSNGLRLDVKGTFTYAKNKLLKIFESPATFNNPNRRQTGRTLGANFGLQAVGLFQAGDFNPDGTLKAGIPKSSFNQTLHPGDIRYADLSGPNGKPDGIIDNNDQTYLGPSNTPQIVYGIEPRLSYKGFDLDLLFQGTGNAQLYVNNYFVWPFQSSASATTLAYRDHWTPDHTDALYPRITGTPTSNNTRQSSWWMRNIAYLRLRSAEVGYTFPDKLVGRSIHNLRVFAAGQNLFTWSPRLKETIDPESSSNSLNYFQQRVISLGINATF